MGENKKKEILSWGIKTYYFVFGGDLPHYGRGRGDMETSIRGRIPLKRRRGKNKLLFIQGREVPRSTKYRLRGGEDRK